MSRFCGGGKMTMTTAEKSIGFTLRGGEAADAERLGTICYEAFSTIAREHNFPSDFQSPEHGIRLVSMLLSRPDAYSVVAVDEDGRPIGSNFIWVGDAVAGVGPITVDPKVQNSSVGRAMMADALRYADENGFL